MSAPTPFTIWVAVSPFSAQRPFLSSIDNRAICQACFPPLLFPLNSDVIRSSPVKGYLKRRNGALYWNVLANLFSTFWALGTKLWVQSGMITMIHLSFWAQERQALTVGQYSEALANAASISSPLLLCTHFTSAPIQGAHTLHSGREHLEPRKHYWEKIPEQALETHNSRFLKNQGL